MRALVAAHAIRPSKSLGQNFLLDANLARAIARDAGVGPGVQVVEIGAGLGSLTVALADAGADRVLAIEFDRSLLPGLAEAVGDRPSVEILHADATKLDWPATLGEGAWVCCGNLPYNVGTSIVLDVLERAPSVARIVVMLQREVADRLAATPAQREAYGAVSLRVAYHARAELLRQVPPEVFWPRPVGRLGGRAPGATRGPARRGRPGPSSGRSSTPPSGNVARRCATRCGGWGSRRRSPMPRWPPRASIRPPGPRRSIWTAFARVTEALPA